MDRRKMVWIYILLLIIAAALLAALIFLFRGKTYTVSVPNGVETDKSRYREGEQVTVRTHTVMDESIDLYVDGEKAVPSTDSDDDWIIVKFTMPAHDVTVSFSSKNISVDPSSDEETQLVSCLSMITGTEIPQPYYQYRLLRTAEGSLVIDQILHEDRKSTVTRFAVDDSAYDELLKVIIDAGMDRWEETGECDPLDGGYDECVFLLNGEYIKVSTEGNMPSNGLSLLGTVSNKMMSFLDDDRIIAR